MNRFVRLYLTLDSDRDGICIFGDRPDLAVASTPSAKDFSEFNVFRSRALRVAFPFRLVEVFLRTDFAMESNAFLWIAVNCLGVLAGAASI